MFIYFVTFSVLCSSPFPGNSQHLFSLLTATICLADIFMELLQPHLFPLCQLGPTCELRAAFPLGHHFSVQSLRFCNSSQLLIIFNTQMTCIMTKPCHFTVYSFQFMNEFVSKVHTPPAGQPLPQDLTMSSYSLFPVLLIHSFFIHPGTFPFTP